MHKVAETAKDALTFLVLATLGLAEVSHQRIFGLQFATPIKLAIHRFHALLRLRFVHKFDVGVPDDVIANVIRHDNFVDFSKFGELLKHLLIKVFEVFYGRDQVLICNVAFTVRMGYCGFWICIHVLKDKGLGKVGLVVQASAGISMSTGPNFVIKWTIYSEKIKTQNIRLGKKKINARKKLKEREVSCIN